MANPQRVRTYVEISEKDLAARKVNLMAAEARLESYTDYEWKIIVRAIARANRAMANRTD